MKYVDKFENVVDAFQMTEEMIKDLSEWPDWAKELYNNDPENDDYCIFKIRRSGKLYFASASDDLQTIDVGDWIVNEQNGDYFLSVEPWFSEKYKEQCSEDVSDLRKEISNLKKRIELLEIGLSIKNNPFR